MPTPAFAITHHAQIHVQHKPCPDGFADVNALAGYALMNDFDVLNDGGQCYQNSAVLQKDGKQYVYGTVDGYNLFWWYWQVFFNTMAGPFLDGAVPHKEAVQRGYQLVRIVSDVTKPDQA